MSEPFGTYDHRRMASARAEAQLRMRRLWLYRASIARPPEDGTGRCRS
jgi:hypothetical protein